jgi:hypothetical protein
MRGRLRLLISVRTATRNLDLQLAIATLRLSGERESDQSRAKQHNTRNGHSQETVRSEFLTHRAPPNRVRPARSERLTCCTVKGIVSWRVISIEVDVSVQHPNEHAPHFCRQRHSLRLLQPRNFGPVTFLPGFGRAARSPTTSLFSRPIQPVGQSTR